MMGNFSLTARTPGSRKQFFSYAIALCALMTAASCKKDDNKSTTPVVTNPNFYKAITVKNFTGDTTNKTAATWYFSLDSNAIVSDTAVSSAKWDVSFGSSLHSFLAGNNGVDTTNYGKGGTGIGGIIVLKEDFDAVVNVPSDDQFKTGKNLYGTDASGAYAAGLGWYAYDATGTLFGAGLSTKTHVAYAMGDSLTLTRMPAKADSTIAPRTVIVRTAAGNYAKIKMISLYKDLLTPDLWFLTSPQPYITFEYVLVPKGSTKFETK